MQVLPNEGVTLVCDEEVLKRMRNHAPSEITDAMLKAVLEATDTILDTFQQQKRENRMLEPDHVSRIASLLILPAVATRSMWRMAYDAHTRALQDLGQADGGNNCCRGSTVRRLR